MLVKRVILLLCLLLSLGGMLSCRTIPIETRVPIRVPAHSEAEVIELAIILGVVDPPPNTVDLQHKPAQITREILAVVLGTKRRRPDWFVESREPGVVYAGYQRRQFYLGVSIHYSAKDITIQIIRSQNLKQSSGRIHKNAYVWIGELEGRIRRALGQVAATH